MEDTWAHRDLPVLSAAVQHFDSPRHAALVVSMIVATTGLGEADVQRALRALASASPPYIRGVYSSAPYPLILLDVTERARRAVGQWPTAEALTDRLIAAIEAAAEQEPNEEKRNRLKSDAAALGGIAKEIVVQVASTVITGSM